MFYFSGKVDSSDQKLREDFAESWDQFLGISSLSEIKKSLLRFAPNVIQAIEDAMHKGPQFISARGKLYIIPSLPIGAISLSVSLVQYLTYLDTFPLKLRPKDINLIPWAHKKFDVIINAPVTVQKNRTLISGEEKILL